MSELLFSFGIIADCQYDDAPDATFMSGDGRHEHHNAYNKSPVKLREAVQTFNDQSLKFVVHLGDFVDKSIEKADVLLEEVDSLKVPFWHVLGNHDFSGSDGDVAAVYAKLGLKSGYYSEVINGYRFIVLDTNELGVYVNKKGTRQWQEASDRLDDLREAGRINAFPWNGGMGESQLDWLKGQLDDAVIAGERCILFAHHPVFPPHNTNALNDDVIVEALGHYSHIVAFINGHNHFGGMGVQNDVPYITVPAVVESETNAYGIVDVYDDHVKIRGYGRVQDMEFTYGK